MKTKRLFVAGIMVLMLTFGSVGIAAAQAGVPPKPPIPAERLEFVYGVVEEGDGEPLTLATPVGPVAVIVDVNTRFRVPGAEAPGPGNLATGEYLGAAGWWEEKQIFHAFGITQLPPDRAFPLIGIVGDVRDGILTIETQRGPATVHVSDTTTYRIQGIEAPDLADLDVGMRTIVKGTLKPDGSLLALGVAVPWTGSRPIPLGGVLLEVVGNTLTVRPPGGRPFTVETDETTEFRITGVADPSVADLPVGGSIIGKGVAEEDGTKRAVLVTPLPEQATHLIGEVMMTSDGRLSVDTPRGAVVLLTDSDTILYIASIESPSLDDLDVDDQVIAVGTWEDEATFRAVGINVRGKHRTEQHSIVRGRTVRVETDQLVLGTPRGPVVVRVDGETLYRIPDISNPVIDDVPIGAIVGVRGTWSEDGALLATGVAVLGERQPPVKTRSKEPLDL